MDTNVNTPELLRTLRDTLSHADRDSAALELLDRLVHEAVPIIVQLLCDERTLYHRSTLLFVCSELDSSNYLDFFLNYFIDCEDSLIIDTLGVVESISLNMDLSNRAALQNKLKSINTKVSPRKKKHIQHLLEIIL